MKITALLCRVLLGIAFLVFGLNGFLHFIPLPPPTSPVAGQFMGVLASSGYLVPVFALQVLPALLLLANRYVPLALTLLAPILVNILLFHALMAPEGIVLPLILSGLWAVVAFAHHRAFASLLQAREPQTTPDRFSPGVASQTATTLATKEPLP